MLQEIIRTRRAEIEESRQRTPEEVLAERARRLEPPALEAFLTLPGPSVIAEIKYRSPSHGPFRCQLPVTQIAQGYIEGGARALSILTDSTFFGGSLDNIWQVYERLHSPGEIAEEEEQEKQGVLRVPLLRKDFVLDRYQVIESRAAGASAYLLIVAALDRTLLRDLLLYGEEVGLEALVEVHDPYELEKALECGARIIGVNNRDLRTFEVDLKTSFDIARRLEGETGLVRVAESGISEPSQVLELWDAGFDGFLIGTSFMDTSEPGKALSEFVDELEERSGVNLRKRDS